MIHLAIYGRLSLRRLSCSYSRLNRNTPIHDVNEPVRDDNPTRKQSMTSKFFKTRLGQSLGKKMEKNVGKYFWMKMYPELWTTSMEVPDSKDEKHRALKKHLGYGTMITYALHSVE